MASSKIARVRSAVGVGLALSLAAAASCTLNSIGGGGAGGTTGTVTSASTAGGTQPTGGSTTTGGCNALASAGTGPFCGTLGMCCCGGSCSQPNTVCKDGTCVDSLPFPSLCATDDMCASGLCLASGICSKPCGTASDCPPSPEWSCGPLSGHSGDLCQCTKSGADVCDGHDNDCNGLVDDGATCSTPGFTCQTGVCACDPANECNGTCKDLSSDVANCGACGNACASGYSCFQSHCEITVVSGISPGPLALAASDLYWGNFDGSHADSIRRVPLAGGAVSVVSSGIPYLHYFAIDAGQVYWTQGGVGLGTAGALMKGSIGGGASQMVAPVQNIPTGVGVGANRVVWLDTGNGSEVSSVPLAGGSVTTSPLGSTSGYNLALTATHVYVAGYGGGMLVRVPIGGGAAVELSPTLTVASRANAVVVDATNVYWTSDDSVLQMPLAGGAAITLASTVTPENLAVDAQYVYFTDGFFTGGVKKVPIGGGALTTLSDGQSGPGFVAVDATSVYWTTLNSIKKAPK